MAYGLWYTEPADLLIGLVSSGLADIIGRPTLEPITFPIEKYDLNEVKWSLVKHNFTSILDSENGMKFTLSHFSCASFEFDLWQFARATVSSVRHMVHFMFELWEACWPCLLIFDLEIVPRVTPSTWYQVWTFCDHPFLSYKTSWYTEAVKDTLMS